MHFHVLLSAAQDTLSPFVAEACLAVMPPLPAKAMLSVENVRVCKLLGGSTADSHVVRGMVVQRDSEVGADDAIAPFSLGLLLRAYFFCCPF